MEQIVYTELEGVPLRWEYKAAVPREVKQTASTNAVSWSVSTTPATQIQNTNTGTGNDVYGSNMVGQIFKTGSNAVKATAVKLYGLKSGSPPSPLKVELNKLVFKGEHPTNITPYPLSGYVKLTSTAEITFTPVQLPFLHPKRIVFTVYRVGSPSNLKASLIRVSDGKVMDSQTWNTADIPTTATNLTLTLSYNVDSNAIYKLVLETTGDDANYYMVNALLNYQTTTINYSTDSESLLFYIPTKLPVGKRVIIVWFSDNGGLSSFVGYLRKANGTLLDASLDIAYGGIWLNSRRGGGLLAFDPDGQATETYTLSVKGTVSNHSVLMHVFNVDEGDTASETKTIGANTTLTYAQKNTSLPAGNYVIIARVETASSPAFPAPAAGIRLKINGTVVASNQFNFSVAFSHCFLVYAGSLSANPTIAIEIYNNTTGSYQILAKWVAFKVDSFNYVDGDAVSLPANTETTLVNLNTTYSSGSTVMALASAQSTIDTTFRLKMNNADELAYPISNYIISPIIGKIYAITSNNPSFQVTAYTTYSGYQGEAKLVVFPVNPNNVWVGAFNVKELYAMLPIPSETVIATGEIAPASVGTSAAWINIPLSSPIVLRPNEYYTLKAYTVGGNASNKYVIHRGTSSLNTFYEVFESSTNGGSTWSAVVAHDLSFTVDGVAYTQIYSGSFSNNVFTPLGRTAMKLSVMAQTGGSMEFAGFDDHTLAVPPTTSTSTSLTEVTALAADAKRERDTPQSNTVSFSVWAAGSGLATKCFTQRHTIMDKNPIYPRDFGFSELYLVADEIGPQGLVVLNDRVDASLYNSSSSQTRFDSYELFRIPVQKVEVLQEASSGGKIVMYFVGIP